MVWHIVRAQLKLTLAHLALWRALETAQLVIKCYFLRGKNPLKKVAQTFLDFFLGSNITLKNNIIRS